MVTSYTHDEKYKGGEKVSLAGVPAAKISEIARNYVYTNMDKIGATEENFKEALGIDSRLTGATLGERLASLEANRAYALKGKTPQQADAINKNYDLVIAYHNVRAEMVQKQKNPGDSKPFTFPSLNGNLREASTDATDGIVAVAPAGAWREKAHNAAERHSTSEQKAKRSDMSPMNAAIDELTAGQQGAIRPILTRAKKEAEGMGVTGSANILANMKQTLEGKGKGLISKTDAQTALDVIARAEKIAKDDREGSNADVFLKGSVWKAQKKAADDAKAAEQKTILFGTTNTHYGDEISNAPADSRKNATLVVMSTTFANGGHFDGKVVNQIFAKLEENGKLQPPYSNSLLRTLYDAEATKVAAKDQNAANAFQAVISILTLENQFAAERAAGQTSHKLFASNDALRAFNRNAFAKAGTYAEGDLTVAPVTSDAPLQGDSQGGPVDSGTVARGSNKVTLYSLKHGTRLGFDTDIVPAPNPDEVPQFTSVNQVKELQRSLGVLEDGMYGPLTHKAMVEKSRAVNESKKPKDYDFTLEGMLASFIDAISKLLGGGQSQTASTGATATDPATALAAIVAGLKDAQGNALSGEDLDVRKTAEFQQELAKNPKVLNGEGKPNPVKIAYATNMPDQDVADSIKASTIAKISATLKAAGVDQDKINKFTGVIEVDQAGHIKGSSIKSLELFIGRTDANDTFDGIDAALFDEKTAIGKQAIPLIAAAIRSGALSL